MPESGISNLVLPPGWKTYGTIELPSIEAKYYPTSEIGLSSGSDAYLASQYGSQLYLHQLKGIVSFKEGDNVCLSTRTASGKSLVFYISAIETLSKSSSSRILAIYPLKALGSEQQSRWEIAFKEAGYDWTVGRIDGQVPTCDRIGIVRNSRVLIATPDILHAWLLSNLTESAVATFLRNLSVVIVDEVHSYTGVFGSNAGFLFRRLQHIVDVLGGHPQFICASATFANPAIHLEKLFGVNFVLIGSELDSSPSNRLNLHFLGLPGNSDFLTEISRFLAAFTQAKESRFIAFVDSRKQTEHISSIVDRELGKNEDDGQAEWDHLKDLDVLPYRAGYEEHDRNIIQERLASGSLKGVISTSALELGIDIPYLDTGILIGVPQSSTSFQQRIGRVGRHKSGNIFIIKTGGVLDETVFNSPEEILKRPPAETALYLENPRIQYIHALCLARLGGEYDQITGNQDVTETEFNNRLTKWPVGFVDLCMKERRGEIPVELQGMKSEGGEDPNHIYPLRDVERQFKVEIGEGLEKRALGSLSFSQLLREAYPGAVYYYTTRTFRVFHVLTDQKLVKVRREKKYSTRPISLPTLVFPNLTEGNVFSAIKYGNMLVIECNLQISKSIIGFKEKRGPIEIINNYPLSFVKTGVRFNHSRFTRNFFTTGVIISHPSLAALGGAAEELVRHLYEMFLLVIPFDRRDVDATLDKMRTKRDPLSIGDKFFCVYDQTYGSLRLSGRLIEKSSLREIFARLREFYASSTISGASKEVIDIANMLAIDSKSEPIDLRITSSNISFLEDAERTRVIAPGSIGIDLSMSNEEFFVEGIFFSPRLGQISYRGKHASNSNEGVTEIVPIGSIGELPGETKWALYDVNLGTVTSVAEEKIYFDPI